MLLHEETHKLKVGLASWQDQHYVCGSAPPIVVVGQSIGPFATPLQRALARWALAGALWTGVRESVSETAVLQLLGGKARGAKVHVMPDVALALEPAPPDDPRVIRVCELLDRYPRPWIGMTVRRWSSQPEARRQWRRRDTGAGAPRRRARNHLGESFPNHRNHRSGSHSSYPGYLEALAEVCRRVTRDLGGMVFLWLRCRVDDPLENDRSASLDLLNLVSVEPGGGAGTSRVVLMDDAHSADVLKACYSRMDAFVATRFHSALFAMAGGVPTVAVDY
ncbi:MAG: polysaccharide pyruvyl transferase family protein [Firmicutes bacterium]|nr:polysaccharide pyruvyl transferase family protein [Bacillota bacterium]MDH7496260.1 polysaccharide pyruvyl transferase family protein [Bacillota bacterium]